METINVLCDDMRVVNELTQVSDGVVTGVGLCRVVLWSLVRVQPEIIVPLELIRRKHFSRAPLQHKILFFDGIEKAKQKILFVNCILAPKTQKVTVDKKQHQKLKSSISKNKKTYIPDGALLRSIRTDATGHRETCPSDKQDILARSQIIGQ